MRILHVVEATVAGVRTHVQALLFGLDQARFQQTVACPVQRYDAFGDTQFVDLLVDRGVPVVPVAMRRSIHPAADTVALGQLIALLRRERFDIVHCHSSKAGIVGRVAARIAGVPCVYTPHSLYFLGQTGAKRRFFLLLEQLAGRLADRVVAVSPSELALIEQHGVARPGRAVCIPIGVAPNQAVGNVERDEVRRELGVGSGPLIGTVARLSPQKNPLLFVDAAAQLLASRPDARFVWCGGGELAAAAQERIEALGIGQSCRLIGHRDDAAVVMAALDVFWLTSDYEGLPTALMEAMALSVPVVATDVTGTRDAVEHGRSGLLVPPHDVAALARATAELLGSPERAHALGQAGQRRVREHFSVEGMLRATERLYDELAGAARPRRTHTAPAKGPAQRRAPRL